MNLVDRGWKQVSDGSGSVPKVEVWRRGWDPFCVELELWQNGDIRGRLCAPGLKINGNMIFDDLPSVDEAVEFLEKLLVGAMRALPTANGEPPSTE